MLNFLLYSEIFIYNVIILNSFIIIFALLYTINFCLGISAKFDLNFANAVELYN